MSLIKQDLRPVMKILWNGYLTLEDAIRIEKKLISVYRKSFDLKNGNDHGLGGKISTRCVHQYSMDGTFMKTFINANQASIATSINDANISRCCYSDKPLRAGDFIWSFNKYDMFPEKYNDDWRKIKGKAVVKTDTEGNDVVYKTSRMASEDTGVNYKKISACCTGRRKSAGGYFWRFQ